LDVSEAALLLFYYEFKLNPGRLVLNYVIMTPVVRSSFAVLLVTARFRHWQQGSRFFMQISGLWLNGCDRVPLAVVFVGSSLVERAFVDWKC